MYNQSQHTLFSVVEKRRLFVSFKENVAWLWQKSIDSKEIEEDSLIVTFLPTKHIRSSLSNYFLWQNCTTMKWSHTFLQKLLEIHRHEILQIIWSSTKISELLLQIILLKEIENDSKEAHRLSISKRNYTEMLKASTQLSNIPKQQRLEKFFTWNNWHMHLENCQSLNWILLLEFLFHSSSVMALLINNKKI